MHQQARRRSPGCGWMTARCSRSASCAFTSSTRPAIPEIDVPGAGGSGLYRRHLLIGGTGRTDLPSGDPDQLYDSLFNKLLQLDPALAVYPAHDYKGRSHTTIADEVASDPRLQKRERAEFVDMMRHLNLTAPDHITEALRTNMSGGKTVTQLLAEATATVPFMAFAELEARLEGGRE